MEKLLVESAQVKWMLSEACLAVEQDSYLIGVGAVILGPATASFYSWSAHYLERVNGLTPPGGGTGIDCDLAADKEVL